MKAWLPFPTSSPSIDNCSPVCAQVPILKEEGKTLIIFEGTALPMNPGT
jgi:hypothetical protein